MSTPIYSLVVPVYCNEPSLPELLEAIAGIASDLDEPLEAVFVVDGSPDHSHDLLAKELVEEDRFSSQLILHSRNFGSFSAIRTGLDHARGRFFATMAADLQEPPELALDMYRAVAEGGFDIAVGSRRSRQDGVLTRLSSTVFWWLYRRFVQPEIPPGGVDMFACNDDVRRLIVSLGEARTSLVGLLYWVGFRRTVVLYDRLDRRHGRSAWTLRRKFGYLTDSVFSFTDLPVRFLWVAGLLGLTTAFGLALAVLISHATGAIQVPGYTATVLTIIFFGALNTLGLGIIGSYVSRTFENTKARPYAVVMERQHHDGDTK